MKNRSLSEKSVLVAMSGGVDSSVAALLLKQAGYSVTGVNFRLWNSRNPQNSITAEDSISILRVKEVCKQLGIDFYLIDLQENFRSLVIDPFVAAYSAGRTPNPCWACNRYIKWATLLKVAEEKEITFVSTGHYARVIKDGQHVQLKKAIDRNKDQSYYLSNLTQKELIRTVFPLGEFTKDQVRALARENRLPTADTDDSQDLCFLNDEDYRWFVRSYSKRVFLPGEIVDLQGKILGKHTGLLDYTVGQRKGIKIPFQEPFYVIKKDMANNQLIVGIRSELGKMEFILDHVNQLVELTKEAFTVKIRYRSRDLPARVIKQRDSLQIFLCEPARDLTPGQVAVVYDDDTVVASGIIRD